MYVHTHSQSVRNTLTTFVRINQSTLWVDREHGWVRKRRIHITSMQMAIKVLYTCVSRNILKACISNSVSWALICCYNSFHSSAKAFSKISYPGCRIVALAQPQNHYWGRPLMSSDEGSQLAFHFIPKVPEFINVENHFFMVLWILMWKQKNSVAFRFP